MKVISLREPYATLIKNKIKLVETRSWKTNYRGELYIHASMSKVIKEDVNNKELMNLLDGRDLSYGKIICKCNLVDCICMTDKYVSYMKENNYKEYICGIYSEGRYAWILEDVEEINPINAKGQLGLWNF